MYAGVDRELAQGQGIWGLFRLPSSRGRPEALYSHPISESLEFSVVATSTAQQHSLSLTFRSVWHSLCKHSLHGQRFSQVHCMRIMTFTPRRLG